MKPMLLSLFLLVATHLNVLAQLQVGIGGGLLFSGVQTLTSSDEGTALIGGSLEYPTQTSYQFNLPIAYRFSPYFALQAEMSYLRYSMERRQSVSIPEQLISLRQLNQQTNANYFFTQLLAKVSTGGSRVAAHMLAGPSVGFSGTGHIVSNETWIYTDRSQVSHNRSNSFGRDASPFNQREFGIVYGAGLTLGLPHYDVFIEARQYRSFNELIPGEDIRMSNWNFQVGVLFPIRF